MKKKHLPFKLSALIICLISLNPLLATSNYTSWALGPFERYPGNPIITPTQDTSFFCPLEQREITWEKDHTFNPGAVVHDGKVYVFYRGEDDSGTGIGMHTSRLGIAESDDGLNFRRSQTPVLFPAEDDQHDFEWPGGCEDPRIVENEEGGFVMLYTQWNRKMPLLASATSHDLFHWKKHGFVFNQAQGGTYQRHSCKSGSIICRLEDDRLIATKIHGKYWMYWGEGIYIAVSDDLISWEPLLDEEGNLYKLISPRVGKFDSGLAEAGPPAILTEKGIIFLYNGKNASENGDPSVGSGAYSAGQLLLSRDDPRLVIDRTEEPFFKPEEPFETHGQYHDGTVFIQGLVHFKKQWFLYYGAADSVVGVAVAKD